MCSKSDKIEFLIYDNANEVIEELFKSLLCRYQIGLETSMRGIYFLFDCVHLLYYKCNKVNSNRGGSYIDSHHWIKKVTINPINKKKIVFFHILYLKPVILNQEKIGEHWK